MKELLEKGFHLGLGILTVTKEKAEKIVEELIQKGKISREEGPKLLKDLLTRAEEEKKALQARIDAGFEKAFHRMNIATRRELEEVNKKLDLILKELKKKS